MLRALLRGLSRAGRAAKPVSHRVFRIRSLACLAAERPDRVRVEPGLPEVTVPIPPIAFGQTAEPAFPIDQRGFDEWKARAYTVRAADTYTLRDALVHGDLGIVTLDDCVLRESLHHTAPDWNGYVALDDDAIAMPVPAPGARIAHGIHAMCGHVGNRNYAHWWVDVVPVIGHHIERGLGEARFLISEIRAPYQRQTLDLLPEIADRVHACRAGVPVLCGALTYTPYLHRGDYDPHPARMGFVRDLMRRAGVPAQAPATRRIYLSRRDAGARPLRNTAEVERVAAAHGYDVVTTDGLPVADQMRLFAQASHVVGPHGAGLANLLFCRPGTRLLELHHDRWINWSLRRLACIVPVTYGCVVGRQDPPVPGQRPWEIADNPWEVDPGDLAAALRGMEAAR